MIAQWATTVAFKAGLYDRHRLSTRPRHVTLRIKGGCSSDLMARFRLKRLSSKGLACFYPTINPLRGRRCDWWITRPTQGSAAWPYYQKYENTCPRFKGILGHTVQKTVRNSGKTYLFVSGAVHQCVGGNDRRKEGCVGTESMHTVCWLQHDTKSFKWQPRNYYRM